MKERIFSGIQPTSELHIGNYLGALKQWVELQNNYECFFGIVDLHALTSNSYEPKKLQEQILNVAFDYLAAGLNPKKSVIFVQSHVPEHTELMWLLNTITPFGELSRMTQWKEKVRIPDKDTRILIEQNNKRISKIYKDESELNKNKDLSQDKLYRLLSERVEKETLLPTILYNLIRANAGLLNYPILMAADILLYKACVVPVGEDQIQHVELTRDLARKFNNTFGQTFPEPKAKITEAKRIMSLSDPAKKMSKSDNEKSCVFLSDSPDKIKEKIMGAVTATSGGNESPGVANLFTLLKEFSGAETYRKFHEEEKSGKIKYSELKEQLTHAIIDYFADYRKKRAKLKTSEVEKILAQGAKKARPIARKTLKEVKEKMGLI